MPLLFRLAIYAIVLFLIAVVVDGQHHTTAQATLRGAARRWVRWGIWTLVLVVVMETLGIVLIGW